ncbi:hypothetical protein [Nocardiopsis sp. NPDC055824]
MELEDERVISLRDLQNALAARQLDSRLAVTVYQGELTPTLCCDPYLGQAVVRVQDEQYTFLGITTPGCRCPSPNRRSASTGWSGNVPGASAGRHE